MLDAFCDRLSKHHTYRSPGDQIPTHTMAEHSRISKVTTTYDHQSDRHEICLVCRDPDEPAERTCPKPCTHACCSSCREELVKRGRNTCPFCQKGWFVRTYSAKRKRLQPPQMPTYNGDENLRVSQQMVVLLTIAMITTVLCIFIFGSITVLLVQLLLCLAMAGIPWTVYGAKWSSKVKKR